jgi:coenzyme F420-dependent glucose-6-phosphate dehydrogenase
MIRIHPAIIAQAAATAATMLPGRFFLGVGTGENLNEHIFGDHWPETAVRREMLEEAVEVIRLLWQGGQQSHRGRHYRVENARVYTLPDEPPPIMVAASGPSAAELAGKIGDGLVSLSPDDEVIDAFKSAGGKGKPLYGQIEVCWAADEKSARRTAYEWWPTTALGGELSQELKLPAHFEQAAQSVSEDDVAEKVICGPDPEKHCDAIKKYIDAGYDHVYLHQIGPEQEGFFDFYVKEIIPTFA